MGYRSELWKGQSSTWTVPLWLLLMAWLVSMHNMWKGVHNMASCPAGINRNISDKEGWQQMFQNPYLHLWCCHRYDSTSNLQKCAKVPPVQKWIYGIKKMYFVAECKPLSDMKPSLSVPFLPQSVPDASLMKRSASTVAPQRPQEVNLKDYTLEKPSQDRPHHHHHHCHHRRERDKDRDREKRQRHLDTPLGG